MNVIAGNCAGVFSGFLLQLAWMETVEKSNGEINLSLHTRNKTHHPGSSYSNYRWLESSEVNNFDEILKKNVLLDFFEPNEYIVREYSKEFTYFEAYPADIKSQLKYYPEDTLKYDGRGSKKEQYVDSKNLNRTRLALNNQWKKFKLLNHFDQKVKEEEKLIEGKKVMSVMLRQTGHYQGVSNAVEPAIEAVKNKIDDYDAVLLTTMIQPFVDEFKKVFGDKCIVAERPRFSHDIDWKGGRNSEQGGQESMTDDEYKIEYQNAFLDVILSSKADFIIGSSSNMFLAALSMNPSLLYDLFYFADGY
jgi:hypothetical protein